LSIQSSSPLPEKTTVLAVVRVVVEEEESQKTP
jgi:hypothetical protein